MLFILYFLIVGSTLMFFILKFDTHQNQRMRKLYKENEDLQPLFLQRSAEQKLKTLHNKLNGYMVPGTHTATDHTLNERANPKQLMAEQLSELTADYNSGKISIKIYNSRLNEMLQMVSESQSRTTSKIHQ